MRRGDLATAAREVAAIERPTPSNLVLAAEIEQKQGAYDRTFALLDRAQEAARAAGQEHVFRLDYLRGDTFGRMNRLSEAAAAFEREVAAFPDELTAWTHLALVQALRHAGCGRLIVTDIAADRLDRASKLGATHAINSATQNAREVIQIKKENSQDFIL